ncbi:MAG: FGGY family carbohydrate kinase, partial [Candidatus Angelobacter sp.]
MPDYIAALDQGTTSTRFIIFDRASRIVACCQREHQQIYPQPGWVEHDAEEIWQRAQQVMSDGLAQSGIRAADLAAIGIANQRETTVVWESKTGKPVANAIVWQDTRVAPEVSRLQRERGDDFFRVRTGLPLSTYFSALKLHWLLDSIPGLRSRAEAGEVLFGNIDAYLLWHLTGRHITDVTNA